LDRKAVIALGVRREAPPANCVRACVRARARARVCVRESVYVCIHAYVSMYIHVYIRTHTGDAHARRAVGVDTVSPHKVWPDIACRVCARRV
jgi:hypothetical protein